MRRTTVRHTVLAAALLLLAATGLRAQNRFTVVTLPDTQNYSNEYPPTYSNQTLWVASSRASLNTIFVTHLGDVTDNQGDLRQWDNADAGMRVLDVAGIPYGVAPGNHDFHYGPGDPEFDGSGTNYRAKFGPQRFAGKSWYGGCSPSQLSNYQFVEYAPGKSLLFLHLSVETPPAELAWAQDILNAHRDKPVWVTTHRYMQNTAQYVGDLGDLLGVGPGRFPQIWYDVAEDLYYPGGLTAERFFNLFVKTNKNIFMVHCGHFHGWYNQTSQNDWGLPVQEILTDYQDSDNGGDGWLRYYTFVEQGDGTYRVEAQTYSTVHNTIGEPSGMSGGFPSHFSFTVDFDRYVYGPNEATMQFRRGGNGAVVDTWIEQANPSATHGSATTLNIDDDTENGLDFGDEPAAQALVRFDGLVVAPVQEGSVPAGVPSDAAVSRAEMTFYVTDDCNMPYGSGDFRIFRLTRGFDSNSTWNSMGGNGAYDDVGALVSAFDSDNVPDGNEVRSVDMLATVNAWKGGAANNGLVFTPWPDNLDWFDDGIEIASSEHADAIKRPTLHVDFAYTVHNVPPVVTQPLTATPATVDEGSPVTLRVGASDANPVEQLVFRINGVGEHVQTGSGLATFTKNFADEGTHACNATVSDDEATVAAGSATVTVRNVAPTIVSSPANTVIPATAPSFAYAAYATDPGIDDPLTYAWDFDNDGSYETIGAWGAHVFPGLGTYPVALRVTDGDGGEDTAAFTVVVEPVAPQAVGDHYATSEDTVLTVVAPGVKANDVATLGEAAAVTRPPVHGTLVLLDSGACTYQPHANWHGTDSFAYALTRSGASTPSCEVVIDVAAVADPPVCGDDTFFVPGNTTFAVPAPGVAANDTDPEPTALTLLPDQPAQRGSVQLESDGAFVYTPPVGFTGSDSFRYRAVDATGLTSTPATVTLYIFNPAPAVGVGIPAGQAVYGEAFQNVLPADAFTDPFDYAALVWTVTSADGTPLPGWIAFDPATHTLGGTPGAADLGDVGLTVTVTDGDGNAASQSFTVAVLPRPLAVAADAKSRVYGDPDPALTYTATGLLAGDTLTGALTRQSGQNVGSYTIRQGTLSAGDRYVLAFTSAALTIAPRPVTVTAHAQSKPEGGADPALTYAASGLLTGHVLTGALTREPGEAPGTYAILRGTLSVGSNYTLAYTGALLTIEAPTPLARYGQWADAAFSGVPAALRSFEADANGDGVPNGFVYAFGDGLDVRPPLAIERLPAGVGVVTPVLSPDAAENVRIRVEATLRLLPPDWTLPMEAPVAVGDALLWRLATPTNAAFFRLRATLLP